MTDMNTKMNHIRKLLNLAQNNPDPEEVKSALLKAQELMVKYNIDNVDLNDAEADDEKYDIVELECRYDDTIGYRTVLAPLIAHNFRCRVIFHNGVPYMFGQRQDAEIAHNVFEFTYVYIKREGEKEVRRYRKEYGTAKGVFNSYAKGFMRGLRSAFDKQCEALVVITPKEVNDTYDETYNKCKPIGKRMMETGHKEIAFVRGYRDGETALNRNKLEA